MLKAIGSRVDLTNDDKLDYFNLVSDLLENEVVLRMKKFTHHGSTTCFQHCLNVSYYNYRICRLFSWNTRAAARAGLLHDLFLYDWHEKNKGHSLHGFKHPYFALRNASRDFSLNDIEKNVIVRHMFPLTPIPPKCREAWIVCMADKYCSARETMYTVKRYAHNARQFVFG